MGRPLARDSGVAIEPDPEPLPPDESLAAAQTLLDEGRAFRAHEVLEAIWKSDDTPTRELWRGLAQLAVGLTHAQRGNARGAVSLLRRARATLASYDGTRPHGVDVDGLRQWAERAATGVEASGDPESISAAGPMPPLQPTSRSGG